MHPVLISGRKAEPMIAQIMSAVKAERWVIQEHDVDGGPGSDESVLASYYGRTKDGGGFGITLTSYLGTEPKPLPGDEDTLVIKFNFSREGSIVSSVEFSYGLDSGCWFVVHESTEFLRRGMDDPAIGLAEQLGIEPNNDGVDHVEDDRALEQIALAADYTFVHCDEPEEAIVA